MDNHNNGFLWIKDIQTALNDSWKRGSHLRTEILLKIKKSNLSYRSLVTCHSLLFTYSYALTLSLYP